MAEIKKSFSFDDIDNIDLDDKNIDWDEDRSGLGQKTTKFYDNFEILYGTLTDLGSNKQNFIDKNLTSNLYPVADVKSRFDNPDGYDSLIIENSNFKKAQEVVDYINTHNKYNEQLLTYEEKRSRYFGDRFYIYYPTNLRILWEFLNAKTRVQALGNPEEAIEFFIEGEDWAETDTEEIIKEKIKSEFPDIGDSLLKKMVKYTNDLIADVYDIETEAEKESKEFNHIQDFVWDYDWAKVNKNISAKKIEEIIKAKFPNISDAHLKWAIKETKDILDDIYFEENYKGENTMITIEEAFKMLNKKPAKRIVEAKEEKECCPECGKCPCECNEELNEKLYKYTPEEFDKIMGGTDSDFSLNGKKLINICTVVDLNKEDGAFGFIYDDRSCYIEDEMGDPGIECKDEKDMQRRLKDLKENIKEGCNHGKKVNEDVEISSEEIKEFIAKVGAEAIERALADFNGGAEEAPIEEPIEEIPAEDEENLELELKDEEKPEEEAAEEEAEEEVKEALNEEENVEEGVGALLGGAAIAGAAAGLANGIVSKIGEGCNCEEEVNEGVAESMPVIPLDVNTVKDYIMNIPAPAPGRPPRFFKLGYIKELGPEIPSKFRGGRGSEGQPFVRIFKCTEYSALYTGNDWRDTDATRAADKILGAERHTGEKTGFSYADEASANRIGTYADGSEALQAYIADHSRQRVKFFISLDDEDLREVSREEVAQYFTPGQAAKLLTPVRPAAGVDAQGNNIYDKPINRFKLTNIYMIGNLGNSIM